jgi:hypothetical protein
VAAAGVRAAGALGGSGWTVRHAQRRGISHLLVIPVLVLTFLLGPGGLLLYPVIRAREGGCCMKLAESRIGPRVAVTAG